MKDKIKDEMKEKKYIIVVGGQLLNKGAQAMTFITVDEMTKRFPEKEIVVMSNKDAARSPGEKEQYRFHLCAYPCPALMYLMRWKLGRWIAGLLGGSREKGYLDLMKNAAVMLDISGYSLGDNWGYKKSIFYLTRIAIARAFKVPVYLMPQSFGPFHYKGLPADWMDRFIRREMAYPRQVMCREQDAYELLAEKGLHNLVRTPDLVLQNRGVDPQNIYRSIPTAQPFSVEEHSVAIVPNGKTIQYGEAEQLYAIYRDMIEELLGRNRGVYLIYHSTEDLPICREIKNRYFEQEDQVRVVERELSCLEFDAMVNRFDYVIASRFHAIVHAFRNGVPVISLGWAVKYQELLETFGEPDMIFDVRGQLDSGQILGAVRKMDEEQGQYAAGVRKALEAVQAANVYDSIVL